MRINKPIPKVTDYCIECDEKVFPVAEKPDYRVCLNRECPNYHTPVTNWIQIES